MQSHKTQRRVLIPTNIERASFSNAGKVAPVSHLTGTTMGTNWSLHAYIPNNVTKVAITSALENIFTAIIKQMSGWEKVSDISRYNNLPDLHSILISQDFQDVLTRAIEITIETEGAFNPAVGKAVTHWGFGPEGTSASTTKQVKPISPEILKTLLKEDKLTQPGGVALDLSSIAKGYTLDKVAKKLRGMGINSFLFEIGGEFTSYGVKPDAQPWWVEIETPPQNKSTTQTIVALCDLSLATSGAYKRCYHTNGKLVNHLINPRTGEPCDNTLASVSVLHKSCMNADAYATALFCMGSEKGTDFASKNDLMALFQHKDGHEILSPAMQALLK